MISCELKKQMILKRIKKLAKYKNIEVIQNHPNLSMSEFILLKDEDGKTVIHHMAMKGYSKIKDIPCAATLKTNTGLTALHILAIMYNESEILDIENLHNITDVSGKTPLHYLAEHKNPFVIGYKSVRLAKDINGSTPIHTLAEKGYTDILSMRNLHLLIDKEGNTPLHILASKNKLEILNYPRVALPVNNYKETPLHILAKFGRKELVETDFTSYDSNLVGRNVLHILAICGVTEIKNHIWTTSTYDNYGETPLHYLAVKKPKWVFENYPIITLNEVISRDHVSITHLIAAAIPKQFIRYLKYDVECYGIRPKDNKGNTPLHYAAMKGCVDVLSHKSVSTIFNCDGDTPLHLLAKNQRITDRKILKHKDVCSFRNLAGETPAMIWRRRYESLLSTIKRNKK